MASLTPVANLRGPRGLSGDTITQIVTGLSWAGAVDLSPYAGESRVLHVTLTGNPVVTLPPIDPAVSYTLDCVLKQDAVGGRSITFRNAVTGYSVTITPSSQPNALDRVYLNTDAVRWWAMMAVPSAGIPTSWAV